MDPEKQRSFMNSWKEGQDIQSLNTCTGMKDYQLNVAGADLPNRRGNHQKENLLRNLEMRKSMFAAG